MVAITTLQLEYNQIKPDLFHSQPTVEYGERYRLTRASINLTFPTKISEKKRKAIFEKMTF